MSPRRPGKRCRVCEGLLRAELRGLDAHPDCSSVEAWALAQARRHIEADAACGRPWVCCCGLCQTARAIWMKKKKP